MNLKNKNLLTGAELNSHELQDLIDLALAFKRDHLLHATALQNKHLALLFEKPSLRTRFSFTIAMRELGGNVVESVNSTRKTEEPEDQIRVLQGYCHALMLRTFKDDIFNRMGSVSHIPIINGLSDLYHPCQILADLQALTEHFGNLTGLKLCYLGDGNNILHSLLLMAPQMGIDIHYCCPAEYAPASNILAQAQSRKATGNIIEFSQPTDAVKNCQAVYTDTWTSMGFTEANSSAFAGYQVNEKLLQQAAKDAVFMHCMPMVRGEEVSQTLPDTKASIIFQQSENRLHAQKALLFSLLSDS